MCLCAGTALQSNTVYIAFSNKTITSVNQTYTENEANDDGDDDRHFLYTWLRRDNSIKYWDVR